MRKLVAVLALALAAGSLGVACGGAAKDERAPASTPASGGAAPSEAPANATPSTATPAEAEPGVLSVAPPQTAREREAALRSAKGDLERAERDLSASLGDCAAACRALASMERATGHLCALASESDDRARCDDAKAKVLAGRARIRASCGACAGGPTLDPGAPIPSGT